MSMSVAEARNEIRTLFDKADLIEKKYADDYEKMPNEDRAEIERILGSVTDLETKLKGLEDAEERKNRILAGMERYNKPAPGAQRPVGGPDEIPMGKKVSPGRQFVDSREYRELKNAGVFNSQLSRF